MIKEIKYIFKRVIIGVLIGFFLFFLRTYFVSAKVYEFSKENASSNGYTTPTWFNVTANSTTDLVIDLMVDIEETPPYDYPYVLLSMCTTGGIGAVRRYSAGQACPNSCFKQDVVYFYTNQTCPVDNDTGHMFYVLAPVNKWNVGSGNTKYWTLNDTIRVHNNYGWSTPTWLNGIYLTDENFAEEALTYSNNQNISALNDLVTSQMNQAHTDAQNTQSAINGVNDSINDSSIPSDSDNKISDIISATQSENTNISDLVNFIPNTLRVIINGFNTSCAGGYSLGSLFGTELIIPCINPVDYLGSFLWGVIDSILCLCYLIPLAKFLVNKYNDLTSLKNMRWQ